VFYCVRTLCAFSDEVRSFAALSEQHLFLLISWYNDTSGSWATRKRSAIQNAKREIRLRSETPFATGLSYAGFASWLRGIKNARGGQPGILQRWNITIDGTVDGAIYQLRTHQARHTRQTALAKDPQLPLLTRQRDLNHADENMQFAYQHTLRDQNQALLEKAQAGLLFGAGVAWLKEHWHEHAPIQSVKEGPSPQFRSGVPSLLNERWRTVLARSPQFFQVSRVPCGYCALPQGPEGCTEYLNCLETTEEGCQWFVTDPNNEHLLMEIHDRVRNHKRIHQESAKAGRVIQSQKYEVLAHRAEQVQGAVLRRTSQELRERLRARRHELEGEES
jgi:uncharacterized protein YecT (DUF1311 family)